MKGRKVHRGRRAVPAAMLLVGLVVSVSHTSAQESYTELPQGLSLAEVLVASGLPLDAADPEGWSRQSGGGGGGPAASPVHYSSVESSVRVPGVSVDSVRAVLEATLRTELEERGVQIVERPRRPGMSERVGPAGGAATGQGDAWTFPWRAPDPGARGWVTLLVLPDGSDRVRLLATSVEVRGGGA